jgi:hypothetical protein
MDKMKPIKINAVRANEAVEKELLTSAEIGKLWATYMGNSMSRLILKYFLQHCDDKEIKLVIENALYLCEEFLQRIKHFFVRGNIPVPHGFTDEDVNLGAPRLFLDEFYLHYLKYSGKAGLSLYAIAIPLMTRLDVREFYTDANNATIRLLNQVNDLLMDKGVILKTPYIPIPEKVEFVKKPENYLSGFFGNIRNLHALEIAHLFDNTENNATSKALLTGFCQVAKHDAVKKFFQKGKDLTLSHIEACRDVLTKEDLPAPILYDHLVTASTFPPFSDKLMLFHKIDMSSMRMRSYGNSASVNGRHDIGLLYGRLFFDIGMYVNEGQKFS